MVVLSATNRVHRQYGLGGGETFAAVRLTGAARRRCPVGTSEHSAACDRRTGTERRVPPSATYRISHGHVVAGTASCDEQRRDQRLTKVPPAQPSRSLRPPPLRGSGLRRPDAVAHRTPRHRSAAAPSQLRQRGAAPPSRRPRTVSARIFDTGRGVDDDRRHSASASARRWASNSPAPSDSTTGSGPAASSSSSVRNAAGEQSSSGFATTTEPEGRSSARRAMTARLRQRFPRSAESSTPTSAVGRAALHFGHRADTGRVPPSVRHCAHP